MKFLIRRTTVVLAGLLLVSPAFGDPIPAWVNSYSVDDSCYCAPNIDTSLSKKITPTPVGGKSVHQICERIGEGPGLSFENGEFNNPVYTDAQCGNGPAAFSPEAQQDCEGRLTDDDIICLGTGPAWDLKSAFARKQPTKKPSVEQAQAPKVAPTIAPKVERAPAAVVKRVTVPATEKDAAPDAIPAATVVAERVVSEKSPVTDAVAARDTAAETQAVERLPLATVVDSQPLPTPTVTSEPAVADSKKVIAKTPAPLLQPRDTEPATITEPAVQTTLVRAPDTDSGVILIETEIVAKKAEPAEPAEEPPATPSVNPRPVTNIVAETEGAQQPSTRVIESPVVAERIEKDEDATDIVADNTNAETQNPTVSSGLRVNAPIQGPGVRFKYVQVAPIGFDFGGNGGALEASVGNREGWGLVGRAAVVEEYSEYMLGGAYSAAPAALRGATMTFTLGAESGTFDLGITDYTDSGVMAAAMLGYDFNSRLQAQGGVSYSTFFDGDPSLIGLLLMHLTPSLDVAARVEMGDNDNASVGLRFHY